MIKVFTPLPTTRPSPSHSHTPYTISILVSSRLHPFFPSYRPSSRHSITRRPYIAILSRGFLWVLSWVSRSSISHRVQ